MNGPLSDGNENIIDIFVLSTNSSDSPVRAGDLEKPGYRITFFTDGTQLFETLRSGKPNLLICDSVTFHEESYDLCRAIKADYDLWVVPVLVITRASNLSDLLHVLDCNADNFISYPYDSSYLSALVEGMLTTPIERPTPEQIKTQFKIQHDEQMFVVTADRRRLLEFLLSSFEIAVNRSGDISRITEENETLSASLKQTEDRVRDQARSIGILNGTLQQKEQAASILIADAKEKDQRIRGNGEEIRRLTGEIESAKNRVAVSEEQIHSLIQEAKDLAHRYSTETGDLTQQLSMLSENLAATDTELKATKEFLDKETSQRTDAETRLSETTVQKELAEKSARSLTLECEQMRVSLSAEKNRAQSAEYEIKALLQAKNESEQDLTRIINELKITANQQGTDLNRQKEELDNGKNRIINLEIQLSNLKTEYERAENELDTRAETYANTISALKILADQAREALADKERETESLKATVRKIQEARDTTDRDLQVRSEELNTTRLSLAEGKEQHRVTEEKLNREIGERDAILQTLRGECQAVQTGFEEQKNTLSQVRHDLESAIITRSNLESRLDTATTRTRELEAELSQMSAASAESGRQVHTLTDELEQVKAELEENRGLYRGVEESLKGEKLEKELISGDLQTLSRERESLQSALAKEKQVRSEVESERERLLHLLTSAEREGKNQESALSATIRELTSELESSRTLLRDLEEQVATLSREKQIAEEKASSLSAEIDQARTALADEWEGHMNAQELFDVAVHEKQQLEKSLQRSGELESEITKKRALIVKGPDLPMNIGKQQQSLNTVPGAHPSEPPISRITNVEDLFEDDESRENESETEDMPSVTIIREPSADEGRVNEPPENDTDFSMTGQEPEYGLQDPEDGSDDDDGIASETQPPSASGESGAGIPPRISFNKAQWFDLLKWAHHSGALSQEQRMQIVRMGRLIQKGRKLTHKQEEQVEEMISLVQAQGYRFT